MLQQLLWYVILILPKFGHAIKIEKSASRKRSRYVTEPDLPDVIGILECMISIFLWRLLGMVDDDHVDLGLLRLDA
jgi:hypothetical protein